MSCVDTTRRSTLDCAPSMHRVRTRTKQIVCSSGIVAMIAMGPLSGCTHQRASAAAPPSNMAPRPADSAHLVPPIAPDYLPDSLFAALGVVRAEPDTAVFMLRSIVKVLFKHGAAQRERQQAIDAVSGVVVGGYRITDDGEYYVRIPGLTADDIEVAIRKLQPLPQVYFAGPWFVSPGGRR